MKSVAMKSTINSLNRVLQLESPLKSQLSKKFDGKNRKKNFKTPFVYTHFSHCIFEFPEYQSKRKNKFYADISRNYYIRAKLK